MPHSLTLRHTTLLLAALVAFGPLSTDLCLPALPTISADLNTSPARTQWAIAVFLGGFSVGMLFYGPLSDRYGRRPLLLGGITLYVLASLGCMLSPSIESLVLWRLLQALGGAAASVLARAVVRDKFPPLQVPRTLSLMHLITMVATLASPLLGSYLMQLSWRAVFAALSLFAAMCLLAVLRWLPESHPLEARGHSVKVAFQAWGPMFRHRRAVGYMLCIGLSFGGMFAFITASPFVYMQYYGISAQAYAALFALNILGVMLLTTLNARWVGQMGAQRLLVLAASLAALSGAALIAAVLSGYGGFIAIVLCIVGFVGVTGSIGANSIAGLMALFPATAGAAASLAVAFQFGMGMLLSALVSAVQSQDAFAMALIVGCSGMGCLFSALLASERVF